MFKVGTLKPPEEEVEDDLDAVVVDIDVDNVPSKPQEVVRLKRQTGFSFSGIFDAFSNIFSGPTSRANSAPFFRSDLQLKSSCGSRSVSFNPPQSGNSRNSRIINGVNAPYGAYPWQVKYMYIYHLEISHTCQFNVEASFKSSLITFDRLPSS